MTESRHLRRWVLTGPIGAGKSLAAGLLAELGAAVIDADAEGHALLREPDVIREITEAFGPDVIRDGQVDRAALGARVFADPDELARLDTLIHPRLSARLAERLAELEAEATEPGLAVVEAAVYFRLPPFGPVDLVVVVDAPPSVRAARLTAGGRLDASAAAERVAAQSHLASDFARADVVLDNDGAPADLRHALTDLYRTYLGGDAPGG